MAHIFISYATENTNAVQRLIADLRDGGVDVWIDRIRLKPGSPDWEQALRDAIRDSAGVVLAASPDSRRSNYVRDELAIADMEGRPVYPAWIAGDRWIDSIPLGRGYSQYADLRDARYADGLRELLAVLRGEEVSLPQHTVPFNQPEPPPPPAEPRNPYKGLQAFRESDARDFFGRTSMLDTLLARTTDALRQPRMVALLGASGSGKSSLMQAGLLPRLRAGALPGSENWAYLDPMVPGTHPIEQLTITLDRAFKEKSQRAIREDLQDRSARGLYGLARSLSDERVVLYIDQFEELFTITENPAERQQFLDLLVTAAAERDGNLIVMLSMRADFYDRPLQHREFGAILSARQVPIEPMSLADFYEAVQGPAALDDVQLEFEDSLITEMVFSVRDEAAALPLLQFTLDKLFAQRAGRKLTVAAYEAIGGVQGALAQHAEEAYAALPDDTHRELARALFLRLIEAGASEQDTTRRRVEASELILPDAQRTRLLAEVVSRFIAARLVVSDTKQHSEQETPGVYYEVSHEALIREWDRLTEWLANARDDLRFQKKLAADVADWQRRDRPPSLLYRELLLAEAVAWSRRAEPTRDEMAFIGASSDAEKQRRAEERAIARRVQNRTRASVLLALMVVATLMAAAVLWSQTNDALSARDEAAAREATANAVVLQANATLTPAAGALATSLAQEQLALTREAAANAAVAVAEATLTEAAAVRASINERRAIEAAFGSAMLSYVEGRTQDAVNVISDVINQYPENSAAYRYRGLVHYFNRDYEASLVDYNRSIELDPRNAAAYNTRGNLYLAQDEYELALLDYQTAVDLRPFYDVAYSNQGLVYREMGDLDQAVTFFSRAISLNDNNISALTQRGGIYEEQREYELALADYNLILERQPNAAAYVQRGDVYRETSAYDAALADFNRALELDPNNSSAYNGIGNVYSDRGQPEPALDAYNRAIVLNPNDYVFYTNRGNVLRDLGQYEAALRDYEQALRLNPQDAFAYLGRGKMAMVQGDYEAAEADYAEALRLEPENAVLYSNIAIDYYDQGELEQARENYEAALGLDPQLADALNGLGNIAYREGDLLTARDYYSAAIESELNYRFYFNRANTYYVLRRVDLAMADVEEVLKLKPDLAEVYSLRGMLFVQNGDHEAALQDFETSLALDPELPAAYLSRGQLYLSEGQSDAALQDFDRAQQLAPDSVLVYTNRGNAYLLLESYEAALADFNRALELVPDEFGAHLGRAVAYSRMGDDERALADMDVTVQMAPNLALAWNNRGFTLLRLGRYDEAISDFNQGLQLDTVDELPIMYAYRAMAYERRGDPGDDAAAQADFSSFLSRYSDMQQAEPGAAGERLMIESDLRRVTEMRFTGSSGETLAVDLEAVDGNVMIVVLLRGPDGEIIAWNTDSLDDGGDDYRTELVTSLPADGDYALLVTYAYDGMHQGEIAVTWR